MRGGKNSWLIRKKTLYVDAYDVQADLVAND